MSHQDIYERRCAEILIGLTDWMTAKEAGATPGQMRSLASSGLVRASPDFATHGLDAAYHHPNVWRRTNAGDRAAKLIEAANP